MEREDKHMRHSISSKVELNAYNKILDSLECCVTIAEMLRPKKKAITDCLSAITIAIYIVGKEASNQKT